MLIKYLKCLQNRLSKFLVINLFSYLHFNACVYVVKLHRHAVQEDKQRESVHVFIFLLKDDFSNIIRHCFNTVPTCPTHVNHFVAHSCIVIFHLKSEKFGFSEFCYFMSLIYDNFYSSLLLS